MKTVSYLFYITHLYASEDDNKLSMSPKRITGSLELFFWEMLVYMMEHR